MAVRKQHKKYTSPRKLFDKPRIDEENAQLKKYGLKNKREIWKADYQVNKIRNQAKALITASTAEQREFIDRLALKGLVKPTAQIDDVLALTKEAMLERRLQTLVFQKKIVQSPKQARQLITHRHIMISNKIVTVPSYFVNLEEEKKITKKEQVQRAQVPSKSMEEIKNE
jgi:small subunit ribosomal protein S4